MDERAREVLWRRLLGPPPRPRGRRLDSEGEEDFFSLSAAESNYLCGLIDGLLRPLSRRDRAVIKLLHADVLALSRSEVARAFGLSMLQVKKIEAAARRLLQVPLEEAAASRVAVFQELAAAGENLF